jgi:hypothetical protein
LNDEPSERSGDAVPADWPRRTFLRFALGFAGAALAGGAIDGAEAARRGQGGPTSGPISTGWIVTRTEAGNFVLAPDPTQLRVTFRNESTERFDCSVEAVSSEFVARDSVFPGQSKVIAVPVHDWYLLGTWDPHGDPSFGISLPL